MPPRRSLSLLDLGDRAAGVEWRRADADCPTAPSVAAIQELAPAVLFGYFVATRVSPNARHTGLAAASRTPRP